MNDKIVRDIPFWNLNVEDQGEYEDCEPRAQSDDVMVQNIPQAARIRTDHPRQHSFYGATDHSLTTASRMPHEVCADRRRYRERNRRRHRDCETQRHRELAQDPADNSTHEQEWNEGG